VIQLPLLLLLLRMRYIVAVLVYASVQLCERELATIWLGKAPAAAAAEAAFASTLCQFVRDLVLQHTISISNQVQIKLSCHCLSTAEQDQHGPRNLIMMHMVGNPPCAVVLGPRGSALTAADSLTIHLPS
jgi:hypothetical protein